MQALDLPAAPWIVGHRGVREAVRENTVESVREAVAQGADMVEVDLQLTTDNELVVHHDPEIRVADEESRPIGRMTLAEIKHCRPVWRRDGIETVYEVPTLGEVLAAAPADLPINLEVKRSTAALDPGVLIDALASVLGNREQLLVSSFNRSVLVAARQRLPNMPLAPLGRRTAPWKELVELARRLDAFSIHIDRRLAAVLGGSGVLDQPAAKERPIIAYTVNRPEEALSLLGFGIAGFFTDRPGALRRQLAELD